jgi:uncharacterized protein (TIGR03435 family)
MISRLSLVVIALAACFSGRAQTTTDLPRFEAASVKISPPPDRTKLPAFGCKGGPETADPVFYACDHATLQTLIIQAFGLNPLQLPYVASGDHTSYDIAAKLAPGATKQQFQMMLQRLLVERFKLTYDYQMKQTQVYDLVVAKNGLKLKPSSTGSSPAKANTPLEPGARTVQRDEYGFPAPALDYRGTYMQSRSGVTHWIGRGVTLDRIAQMLATRIGKPVSNATAVDGEFDFTVNFSAASVPGSGTPDPPRAGKLAGTPDDLSGDEFPSLFAVLEKQLGLRLMPKEGSIDLFVIDRAEVKPTDN